MTGDAKGTRLWRSKSDGPPPKWIVETHQRGVDALHALGIPSNPVRTVRICIPERAAIVLGSAQKESDIDLDAVRIASVDVVRRKSGGGAVLVEPDGIVWFDVIIPAGDELWDDDVGRAFHWLGRAFADAFRSLGHDEVRVHEGALVTTEWSRAVCFAGLGPGECEIGNQKVVGISQRRTRDGALFQCAIARRFDADRIASLLALDASQRAELSGFLRERVAALPDLDPDALTRALIHSLP